MSDEQPISTLWTAGGAADEFRSHQLRRAVRRLICLACLLILATILIVGIPGWMTYLKYQDARRQMLIDEFVSLRMARGKVKEATEIDRDVERVRTLHQPVGSTLNETPWRSTSTVIESKVRELNQRHVQISSLLDAGEVREAEEKVPTAADLQMVAISSGKFTMGWNGEGASSDETPHEVTIARPFFVGKYEVTTGQTVTWLNSPGVTFKDEWINLSDSDCPVRKNENRFERNTSTTLASSDLQPMQNITWFGAVAFCEWCSKQDSRFKYRLPTEAEWEYVARAGSTSSFPWGDSCNGTEANVNGTSPRGTTNPGPFKQVTTTVGAYSPNAWGLHDTVGNTWEWCSDWIDPGYYAVSPATDPQGPSTGSSRVLRGGSWGPDAIYARSSRRYLYAPDFRYTDTGFRVVFE